MLYFSETAKRRRQLEDMYVDYVLYNPPQPLMFLCTYTSLYVIANLPSATLYLTIYTFIIKTNLIKKKMYACT